MNCLSLNICGTVTSVKRSWVQDLCIKHRVSFLGLQCDTRQFSLFKSQLFCNGQLLYGKKVVKVNETSLFI